MSFGNEILGMMAGGYAADHQDRRQRGLMGLYNRYQQELNQQGHDLQYEMWNKTNYGAQVKHMLKAGLNPALMYGSAGQGGTTGSQGGGSAAAGNAAAFQFHDLQNSLIEAQKEKLEAEKDNIAKDTEVKDELVGKTREEKNKVIADKLLSEQNLSESKQRELNLKTENEIKEFDRDYMKKHYLSTYDTGIIRTIKASGMSIGEALKYFDENGGIIKSLMKGQGTGKPKGDGSFEYREGYIWDDRSKKWIKI
jgi:hypothetical protein